MKAGMWYSLFSMHSVPVCDPLWSWCSPVICRPSHNEAQQGLLSYYLKTCTLSRSDVFSAIIKMNKSERERKNTKWLRKIKWEGRACSFKTCHHVTKQNFIYQALSVYINFLPSMVYGKSPGFSGTSYALLSEIKCIFADMYHCFHCKGDPILFLVIFRSFCLSFYFIKTFF